MRPPDRRHESGLLEMIEIQLRHKSWYNETVPWLWDFIPSNLSTSFCNFTAIRSASTARASTWNHESWIMNHESWIMMVISDHILSIIIYTDHIRYIFIVSLPNFVHFVCKLIQSLYSVLIKDKTDPVNKQPCSCQKVWNSIRVKFYFIIRFDL